MADLSDKELRILAATLIGEAVGEGTPGMIAVMNVIKNRARDPRFPSNPALVATQGNASGNHAFSVWNAPDRGAMVAYGKDSSQYKEAERIVKGVWSGNIADNTSGAINYYANKGPNAVGKPSWFDASATAGQVQIGNHVFGARTAPTPMPRPLTADAAAQVHVISVHPDGTPVEGGGGLITRHVTTVPIEVTTGNPVDTKALLRSAQNLAAAPLPKVTFVPSQAKNNLVNHEPLAPLITALGPDAATARKEGASLGALLGSMAGAPTKFAPSPSALNVAQNVAGGAASLAPHKEGTTTYFPPGPNYGYNARTGAYEVRQPNEAYAVDPLTVHQTSALKAIDTQTTKTITTYSTVVNPEYKKKLLGGGANSKLLDIHDKNDAATMAAMGVPQFITVPKTVTVNVPKKIAPVMQPSVPVRQMVTPAGSETVLSNGMVYRPASHDALMAQQSSDQRGIAASLASGQVDQFGMVTGSNEKGQWH